MVSSAANTNRLAAGFFPFSSKEREVFPLPPLSLFFFFRASVSVEGVSFPVALCFSPPFPPATIERPERFLWPYRDWAETPFFSSRVLQIMMVRVRRLFSSPSNALRNVALWSVLSPLFLFLSLRQRARAAREGDALFPSFFCVCERALDNSPLPLFASPHRSCASPLPFFPFFSAS